MPVEPPASPWRLPLPADEDEDDLIALGADLAPGTLLAAYRTGLFPMGVGRHGAPPLGWWSPNPRGILLPGDLVVRSSLRKALRRFEVRVDTAFAEVLAGCADRERSGRWITPEVAAAYLQLHRLGWAHSVETWRDGELRGGLYGVSVGGLFAGESMFHRDRDASKAALVALVEICFADGHTDRMIDTQWATPHLLSLGVREVSRADYRRRLAAALAAPPPAWPSR